MELDHPEPDQWTDLIPEREHVLQTYTDIGDRYYATYLENVSAAIHVFDADGDSIGTVPVPPHHAASIRSGPDDSARMTLSSFLSPAVTYTLDLDSFDREIWEPSVVPFDGSPYTVTREWYTSADGTRGPMYVVHRRDLVLDGSHPTVLYGYGGFNVALTPRFDAMAAVWLEHGGVYAMATLRGGSEFGETWHRDGMLENKQNVFDDFIAAAERLIDAGYTNPERLAIRGASNGGLLVGSALTQRPELYRAVLCGFPDLDMVRFWTFTETNNLPALLEYGDASRPDHFAFMRRYSPYQNVRRGTDYPAVMLSTGDLDTRVPPLQARKMTAALQHATSSGLPILLRYREKAGHAGSRGIPMSQRLDDLADELVFIATQLGAPE